MKKIKSFRHLDQYARDRLESLWRNGHTKVEIARVLKVNKSTLSREINRSKRKNGVYDAVTAQHKALVKRSNSKYQGMKIEADPGLRAYVTAGLTKLRSPNEISGRMKREKQPFYASTDAIYKWLYSVYGQRYCRYLCTRRSRKRKQKKNSKREVIPNKISVRERPRGIKLHPWEWDAMVSPKKTKTTACIAVACAIKEKYISGNKLENLKPENTKQAVQNISSGLQMDSITLDSGIENRLHREFGIPAYFCDPHSPWQKPHVENSIGLLRRWFLPKKTDLSKVTGEELQIYFDILNHKYRKSLNYQSAYEVARKRGILKTKSCISL